MQQRQTHDGRLFYIIPTSTESSVEFLPMILNNDFLKKNHISKSLYSSCKVAKNT